MKKRASTTKKSAGTKPAAKARPAVKAAAKKSQPSVAKAPAKATRTAVDKPVDRSAARYTPQQIEGVGWKPFRYPPE